MDIPHLPSSSPEIQAIDASGSFGLNLTNVINLHRKENSFGESSDYFWVRLIKTLSLDIPEKPGDGIYLKRQMSRPDFINLSGIQRRAVMKIAIELVKADSRIHSKEVGLLDELQKSLELSQEELDLTHYLSLESAVSCLDTLDEKTTTRVINLFKEIMCADNDIDFEENLLLSSISMSCDTASRNWCRILSVNATESGAPARQIVFLERETTAAAREVLGDKYDNLLISKAFGDIGFEFFYLPDIIEKFGRHFEDGDRFELLKRSMEYIAPAGDRIKLNNLRRSLAELDTKTFYHIILSRFDIDPDRIPYPAFLLVKIRESHILDDANTMRRMVDFLCIDISSEVKRRILDFVSRFDKKRNLLSYDGYHRFLFDYLSSESKNSNPITINSKGEFILGTEEGGTIRFKSAPQAATLYILLLSRGKSGVPQTDFDKAANFLKTPEVSGCVTSGGELDLPRLTRLLDDKDDEYAKVLLDTITIYRTFSTKDSDKASFLGYIEGIFRHRSSLKTYINTGFASSPRLANPDHFTVGFNPVLKTYSVSASPSLFLARLDAGAPCPLTETSFWKSLNSRRGM